MRDKFDFENIGKRLPYTMPENTYSEMESKVFAALREDEIEKKTYRRIKWWSIAGVAMAASVALLLTIVPPKTEKEDLLEQIDLACAKLSETDMDFLIEISQEDIFLNQER